MIRHILTMTALLLTLGLTAYAQIPRTLSVQGALTDNSGKALTDGTHSLRVALYSSAAGGSALHQETFSAQLRGGVFSVVLGAATPIPAAVAFDAPYWLGFSVDGAAELSPRTPMTSVPYALYADESAHAATADEASSLAPGATGVVTSLNGTDGDITLLGAGGTSVTRDGGTITITSSGGSASGIAGLQNGDGTIAIQNPNGPVATVSVAQSSINTLHLVDDAVTGSKIADGAVNAQKLGDGSVVDAKIVQGAVTEEKIANGAVTGVKIARSAVTLEKISTAGASSGQVPTFDGSALNWATPQSGGGGLTLPYTGQTSANGVAFSLKSTGGTAMVVEAPGKRTAIAGTIDKPWVRTNVGVLGFAENGEGVCGESENGLGVRGWSQDGVGVTGLSTNGTGVHGIASSSGPGVHGESATSQPGVRAENTSTGSGLLGVAENGTGVQGTSTSGTALYGSTTTGVGLKVRSQAGDVIQGYTGTVFAPNIVFRVTTNGTVKADGTFLPGGADLAEGIEVDGALSEYEPGDVLVISAASDRRVVRSSRPNAVNVAGVYATKPGVLLSPAGVEDDMSHLVPLGVVGIIPTKVCMENGPIQRGDPLVTSSTPGHAMKARPVMIGGVAVYPTGAILGKALQNFSGPDTGKIEVLVNAR